MKAKNLLVGALKALTKPAQPQELKSVPEAAQEVKGMTVDARDRVGPVLQAGTVADAIIEAIKDLNEDVQILDRGAYLRVLVPRRCVVTGAAIEKHLGRPFRHPGELEVIMSSFKGTMHMTQDETVWELRG